MMHLLNTNIVWSCRIGFTNLVSTFANGRPLGFQRPSLRMKLNWTMPRRKRPRPGFLHLSFAQATMMHSSAAHVYVRSRH